MTKLRDVPDTVLKEWENACHMGHVIGSMRRTAVQIWSGPAMKNENPPGSATSSVSLSSFFQTKKRSWWPVGITP